MWPGCVVLRCTPPVVLSPPGARHGFAEIDVARLVARRVGIRDVVGDELGTAPTHVERGGVYGNILVETQRHGNSRVGVIDSTYEEQSKRRAMRGIRAPRGRRRVPALPACDVARSGKAGDCRTRPPSSAAAAATGRNL